MDLLSYINVPFGYLMKICLYISGNYYVIAIFFFTLITQLLMLPLAIKQQKSLIMQVSFA
jgi:YidC/Oxa1 family membrane protein insertase